MLSPEDLVCCEDLRLLAVGMCLKCGDMAGGGAHVSRFSLPILGEISLSPAIRSMVFAYTNGYSPVKQALQYPSLASRAFIMADRERKASESAPMCSQISSRLLFAAMSSSCVAMSTPMKQGKRIGGQATRTCTSVAPASRSNWTRGPAVLPRTMESSTMTTRCPCRFCSSGLNFMATPILRNWSVGSMKVRPI